MRGDVAGGAEDESGGAAENAAKSTSLKEREGAPPPDFPEGGDSWLQRWALLRPVAVTRMDPDAGGEEGEVDAGLGLRAGVGLVEVAIASGQVGGRGGGGGDERFASFGMSANYRSG